MTSKAERLHPFLPKVQANIIEKSLSVSPKIVKIAPKLGFKDLIFIKEEIGVKTYLNMVIKPLSCIPFRSYI